MRAKAGSKAVDMPAMDGDAMSQGSVKLHGSRPKLGSIDRPDRTDGAAPGTIFGYRFRDSTLLELALTHRSLAYEAGAQSSSRQQSAGGSQNEGRSQPAGSPQSDNEQFEFLGDAVLGLVVAESLFGRFPDSREGELTRLRASMVSRRHLGEVAARLQLGERLRLGKGEERTGGRRKPALLSNALEAVIAAMYLDGGLSVVAEFIDREIVTPALPALSAALETQSGAANRLNGAVGDHKSALQERLQAAGYVRPQYVLIDQSGPDHQKRFSIEVRVTDPLGEETALGLAEGATKKEAQQEAARLALLRLDAETRGPGSKPTSTKTSVPALPLHDAMARNGNG